MSDGKRNDDSSSASGSDNDKQTKSEQSTASAIKESLSNFADRAKAFITGQSSNDSDSSKTHESKPISDHAADTKASAESTARHAGDTIQEAGRQAQSAMKDVADKTKKKAGEFSESASQKKESMKQSLQEFADSTKEKAISAKDQMKDKFAGSGKKDKDSAFDSASGGETKAQSPSEEKMGWPQRSEVLGDPAMLGHDERMKQANELRNADQIRSDDGGNSSSRQ